MTKSVYDRIKEACAANFDADPCHGSTVVTAEEHEKLGADQLLKDAIMACNSGCKMPGSPTLTVLKDGGHQLSVVVEDFTSNGPNKPPNPDR
ncbi:MAG: hypothetical protein ABI867_06060 [Kofleriaceae bacterium]